ncbi:hypothetical protein FXW78_03170 [Rhodococcus opacus]|nr:hypothetical protein [Rhodococcus opacus]
MEAESGCVGDQSRIQHRPARTTFGTVGAALTAASLDVCAAAFSTEAHSVLGLNTTSRVARCVIGGLADAGLPPVAVNVNVPALPFAELSGLCFADPGPTSCEDVAFDFDGDRLSLRRRRNPPPYVEGSDADLLSSGLVAVSVLTLPWRTDVDAESRVQSAIERRWIASVEPDSTANFRRQRV